MISKLTILLGIIMVASLLANAYLYQKSASLQSAVVQLQSGKGLNNSVNGNNQPATQPITNVPQSTITGTVPPGNSQQQTNPNRDRLNFTSQSIAAVAVKAVPVREGFFETVRYQGTVMDITVDIRSGGKGLVLVDTEVPTGVDFQTSARTAVEVAKALTGADLSDKDVIFSIKSKDKGGESSDLQAVDGPSAGAAMTVLIASELEGKAGLKQEVVMTGTIEADGTIGPVGGVPEKAVAAGEYGAKIFLVPVGEATYTDQVCHERQEGPIVYQTCQAEQKPLSDYTEKQYGMKVVEVKDVKEALSFFSPA
jgi:uncharacterized protein